MLRVGIIGVTGYAGEELLKILLKHAGIEITSLSAKIDQPTNITEIFPYLCGKVNLVCQEPNLNEINANCDVVFLALPHGASMEIAPAFIQRGKMVIDLSADYRLIDEKEYTKWYQCQHQNPGYLKLSVYGLPELYREKIKKAKLVANPGCYPTAAILGLAPLLKYEEILVDEVIVDAKSGYSGAGRERVEQMRKQLQDNFKAYKIDQHQHIPEINQEISKLSGRKLEVTFVPHILPIERGILSTIYVKLKNDLAQKVAYKIWQEFYKREPFVKVVSEAELVQIADVVKTNFCQIGVKYSREKKLLIIVTAIDNLIKGASGQAVQNMNIMCGFEETLGLL